MWENFKKTIINSLGISIETRKLLSLAFPIIGSYLLHTAYNLTDMIWVGRISSSAVAAVGSAGFFLSLGWALSSIITVGANVKISHSVGAKNKIEAGRYATSGAWGVGGLAIIISILLYVYAADCIAFFEMDDAWVNAKAESYLTISIGAGVLSFFNLLFISIFNAFGKTKISFIASIVGTGINILLDPLFIFTFGMGVEGAAVASIIGRSFSLMYFVWAYKRDNEIKFVGVYPRVAHLKELFRIGTPAAFQRISFTVIYILLARIISEWGPEAIAVQKIGVQIESFTFMMVGGVMQAVTIMVGHRHGAKDVETIPIIYKSGIKIAMVIASFTTLLFLIFPEELFSIFISEKENILLGESYLRILAVSQVFMCLEMITTGVLNGIGKTSIPATVSVIFTSMRLPIAYFLGFYTFLELDGVWWSISITSIFKGIALVIIIRYWFLFKNDNNKE